MTRYIWHLTHQTPNSLSSCACVLSVSLFHLSLRGMLDFDVASHFCLEPPSLFNIELNKDDIVITAICLSTLECHM